LTKEKPPLGNDGLSGTTSSAGFDNSESAPKTAPAQENLLLAIKALAAEEIRADALENIQIMLAASGWCSAAALLVHAARCADAGDFLAAERNRQLGRKQFLTANDTWRQFMEARGTEARAKAFAEVFQ
jgi:hypothetical protein